MLRRLFNTLQRLLILRFSNYHVSITWIWLKFKWHLRLFCGVTHYVILNVILYAFYKLNGAKLTFFSHFLKWSGIICDVNISFVSHFVELKSKCQLNLSDIHAMVVNGGKKHNKINENSTFLCITMYITLINRLISRPPFYIHYTQVHSG